MQFYEINICQAMIFRLYIDFNKHEMIKIGNQTKEKSQVFEKFGCRKLEVIKNDTDNNKTYSAEDCDDE